jgi:HAD superfamily hydrolase (TIGR01509 family)
VTPKPLRLVIFDCDGVLIDSEPLSRRVIAEEAAALGWAFSEDDAKAYTGLPWSDLRPIFAAATGRSLPEDWALVMQRRVIAAMAEGLHPVPGAAEVLDATRALGLTLRVASNSSHEEMAAKFATTGLASRVQGLLHSARDVARGKPAPDVFLAAAAAARVEPAACLVVEDSRPGIAAARAAGMACVAYAPEGLPPDLAGTVPSVAGLASLIPVFRQAMTEHVA